MTGAAAAAGCTSGTMSVAHHCGGGSQDSIAGQAQPGTFKRSRLVMPLGKDPVQGTAKRQAGS